MLVEASRKYQVNVDVKKFSRHENVAGKSMSNTILPVFWYEKVSALQIRISTCQHLPF